MVKLEISNENLEAIIGHREVFDRLGILDVMLTSSIRHHYVIIKVVITMKYIVLTVEALTELEIKNAKIKAKNFIYKINRYQKKR